MYSFLHHPNLSKTENFVLQVILLTLLSCYKLNRCYIKLSLVNILENVFVFIKILFKMLLFKGGVLIYAEHCKYFSQENQHITQETFLIINNAVNSCFASYFHGNSMLSQYLKVVCESYLKAVHGCVWFKDESLMIL